MDAVWLIFLFILGACVGSFLNVVIYRLPRGESIVFPGSRCPSCGRSIRAYDNIPLVSWLVLRGRCRACKAAISPRYILIEAATAALLAGLYACYFILDLRQGVGRFHDAWPMYLSHAALLAGLLACLVVDLELWIIPLEVMWVCSLIGLAAAVYRPHPFLPLVSADLIAMGLAALIGLGIAELLVRAGYLQQSFLDAEDAPLARQTPAGKGKPGAPAKPKGRPKAVAITAAHGVSPRKEILREVLFLAPAAVLAIAACCVLRYVPPVATAWRGLFSEAAHPSLAPHLAAGGSALFGYLVGGLWIWGVRIAGTLAFGKEAMGLGDAHLLAAVGAVTGWIVPTLTFFVAPFLGLLWALYLWIARSQRELPYGPWLAAAALIAMLFYDAFHAFLSGYADTIQFLLHGAAQ